MNRLAGLRVFVLILITLMVAPIFFYKDYSLSKQGGATLQYRNCSGIESRLFFAQCVQAIYERRLERCEAFGEPEQVNNCQREMRSNRLYFMGQNSSKLSFSLMSYLDLLVFSLILIVVTSFFKGPLLTAFPRYGKWIGGILEVLPKSDYLTGVSWGRIIFVLTLMTFSLIAFKELIFVAFYS
jgi:hypothetical protein